MSEYTLLNSIQSSNPRGEFILIKPGHNHVGFCGYLWQVIRAIYKYPNQKYYIFIGNHQNPDAPNVWDFYFKQPSINSRPSPDKIIHEVGLLFDQESEFVEAYPCMQQLSIEEKQERKNKFSNIVNTYFQLLPELKSKIERFKENNFKNKKIFGFHSRGTDHPDKKDISESFEEIDKLLETHDLMFASSDEKDIITSLKNRYGDKMLTYDSSTRSEQCDFQMPRTDSDAPTHAFRYNALINWTKNNDGYKIGEDIIMETHLLASTKYLLCACDSNVNYFVRAIDSSLPYKILYTPKL